VTVEGGYGRGRNFFPWCQRMTSHANEYLQQRYSIFEWRTILDFKFWGVLSWHTVYLRLLFNLIWMPHHLMTVEYTGYDKRMKACHILMTTNILTYEGCPVWSLGYKTKWEAITTLNIPLNIIILQCNYWAHTCIFWSRHKFQNCIILQIRLLIYKHSWTAISTP
jgi:hypothetical protein